MIYSPTKRIETSRTDAGGIQATFIMRTGAAGGKNCYTSVNGFLDALNGWMEASIYDEGTEWGNYIRQNVQSEFEEEVNQFFIDHGFKSGNLEQDGKWNSSEGLVKTGLKVSGEIDALAISHSRKVIYVIECKRFADFLTAPQNLFKKIKSNSNKICNNYVRKIHKKRTELGSYLAEHYPDYQVYTALVTDISVPVYLWDERKREWEAEVAICDFEELKNAVVEKRKPLTRLVHLSS